MSVNTKIFCPLLFFRCWVVADRGDFNIEVFNVDYGNTAIINKRDASLTVPHVWDLQPAVRPFKIKGMVLVIY